MMNRKLLLFLAILIFLPFSLLADGNEGTEDIFNFGAGARALGMGRTFVGLGDDVSTIYWNPAGIYSIDKQTFSLFYSKLFYDTMYGFMGYVYPSVDYGSFGIGILSLYTGGIQGYDSEGFQQNTFGSTKLKFLVSYANMLPWFPLLTGVSLKMNLSSIDDRSATSFNLDVGLLYYIIKDDFKKAAFKSDKERKTELTAGLVFKNLFFGTGERLYLEEDEENFELKAGVAYFQNFTPAVSMRALLDLLFYEQRTMQFSFGLEAILYNNYFVRTGYTLDSGFSFGAGVSLFEWKIDYALVFRPLGATHNLSISWSFGEGRMQVLQDRERKIQARIKKNVIKERILQENKFGKILKKKDLEMKDLVRRWKATLKKSESRLQALKRRSDEQIGNYRRRLEETIKKNDEEIKRLQRRKEQELKSMRVRLTSQLKNMQKVYQSKLTNLENSFSSRLRAVSLTNTAERNRLKQQFERDKRQLRFVEQEKSKNYSKGVELYNKGQYKEATTFFNRVARLDPGYADLRKYMLLIRAQQRDVTSYGRRILVLYRRGVGFYLRKQYQRAIAVWQEILKIDPYNKLALRNIDMAKKRLQFLKKLQR